MSTVGSIVNHVHQLLPERTGHHLGTGHDQHGAAGRLLGAAHNSEQRAQVQAFIRALAVRENSSTLVSPRLTVFNTQRANMFVARQQSYVSDYEISGDSYDPVIRQFLVGVVLDVEADRVKATAVM